MVTSYAPVSRSIKISAEYAGPLNAMVNWFSSAMKSLNAPFKPCVLRRYSTISSLRRSWLYGRFDQNRYRSLLFL